MKKMLLAFVLSAISFADSIQVDGRYCNVNTYFVQNVSSGQCPYFDQVMVGVRSVNPLVIRCARLIVSCNDRPSDNDTNSKDESAR